MLLEFKKRLLQWTVIKMKNKKAEKDTVKIERVVESEKAIIEDVVELTNMLQTKDVNNNEND